MGVKWQLSFNFGDDAYKNKANEKEKSPPVRCEPLPGTENLQPEFKLVAPDEIQADPLQPRRNFPREGLLELAASISRVGLIEPLVVEASAGPGKPYVIIAGERRHRAFLLGRQRWPDNPHFQKVRCLVYPSLPAEVRAALQLEENSRRAPLTAYEIAAGLHRARVALAKNQKQPPEWEDVLELMGLLPGKELQKWLR